MWIPPFEEKEVYEEPKAEIIEVKVEKGYACSSREHDGWGEHKW
jgi:hypothetical protein